MSYTDLSFLGVCKLFPISIDFYLIFVPNLYLNKKVEVFEQILINNNIV